MTKKSSGMAISASSLLCLFVLAGALAAAADGEVMDTTTIRLPTDDNTDDDRPWDCCDDLTKSPLAIFPPLYSCNDEVKKCNANCKNCEEAPGDFPRAWICRDSYQTTDPGPRCTAPNTKRPWTCCDDLKKSPLRIFPPLWRCDDRVGECNADCNDCVVAAPDGFSPGRYVCKDWYWGEDPGPICKARPWGECCDNAPCTRSIPPICRCGDVVETCAATCQDCERAESSSDPPRFVCRDQYVGYPGRECTL